MVTSSRKHVKYYMHSKTLSQHFSGLWTPDTSFLSSAASLPKQEEVQRSFTSYPESFHGDTGHQSLKPKGDLPLVGFNNFNLRHFI